ncbi:MAG TPA: M12 family metallo-peptidase [Chitinophagaceae bacterium]|nr:M12 family metallo-peptidase [Chitinophagaceae bacterium]
MRLYLSALLLFLLAIGCSKTEYVNNPGGANELHDKPVGTSARPLLSASPYSSLRIEIQYMPGYAPDQNALAHVHSMLSSILNKPGGITIATSEIPASSGSTLNIEQVFQVEKNNRRAFTTSNQIAVYVLYTNGHFTDGNVLGAAYRNTSVVLFGRTIHENSGGLGQVSRTKLEATVLEHELGHLLGLVDLGTPMQTNHRDAAHGHHCNNNSCLMYYTSDTRDILGFLLTGSIPSLDANCRADLQANGGL